MAHHTVKAVSWTVCHRHALCERYSELIATCRCSAHTHASCWDSHDQLSENSASCKGYQSTRHTVISSQASTVQIKLRVGHAKLCRRGGWRGQWLYSFICGSGNFSGHPMIRPPKLGLGAQNSAGMRILRVTTNVQNLDTPDL